MAPVQWKNCNLKLTFLLETTIGFIIVSTFVCLVFAFLFLLGTKNLILNAGVLYKVNLSCLHCWRSHHNVLILSCILNCYHSSIVSCYCKKKLLFCCSSLYFSPYLCAMSNAHSIRRRKRGDRRRSSMLLEMGNKVLKVFNQKGKKSLLLILKLTFCCYSGTTI